MISKKYLSILCIIFFVLSGFIFAQDDNVVQLEPYNVNHQDIIEQIIADTTGHGGIPEGRIYEMVGGEVYLATATFYVAAEEELIIRSSNDEKAILYLYPTGGTSGDQPPGYLFRSRGGDITMEGIALAGYFELGDDPENGIFDYFSNVQGGMLRVDGEGASVYMINCIFSNINGQVLRTEGATNVIWAEDCVFSNLGALSTSNFGAGKGIDLRAVSCDSLILINNTFVNYQDRVIRHYNYSSPLEGTGILNYAYMDHNTFVDGMGFHGVLSLGSVGDSVIIKNSLFVDAFAAGEDPTDTTRAQEWGNVGEVYDDSLGLNKMYWIFASPNETTTWVVNNNYYAVTAEGQAFFDTYEEISVGTPLSGYIREALGDDSTAAFTMIDDPVLTEVPELMVSLMTYYVEDAGKTKDTPNSTWDPQTQDMDRQPITYYVNDLDVSYSLTSPAYIGAENGFPAGDLNGFPTQKALWEVTGVEADPEGGLAKEFALSQNYPNPFNPTTYISFSIPEANHVMLKVYNILGQEVATLVNKEMAAGPYKVNFDASQLASGVYIYTISAGDFSASKKMMLLK